MSVLIVHLSDVHLKTPNDPILQRVPELARVIAAEFGAEVKACVIAFTGDVTDKGSQKGFGLARDFFPKLFAEISAAAGCVPDLLIIPGNHDLVLAGDMSVREILIDSLQADVMNGRPKEGIEKQILAPFDTYFGLVESIAGAASPTRASPYYAVSDKVLDGRKVRFHLLNTAWMCKPGQDVGSLFFPLPEIKSPNDDSVDYQITLLHHPFAWFKQPEAMRPLRDAVEKFSDMIMTGHEHVGRSMKTDVHGLGAFEYREGGALQEGKGGEESSFHLLKIDFTQTKQFITTYEWVEHAYVRTVGPVESSWTDGRRAGQAYRLRVQFETKLDDPELPIVHPKHGKLTLSDFYTYPDLKKIDNENGNSSTRLPGSSVSSMISGNQKMLFLGPDRCGKSSFAKRLFVDIHAKGLVPVLLNAGQLSKTTPEKAGSLLESKIKEQYETLAPEAYWQLPLEKRVLILDDLHHAASDQTRRDGYVQEMERRFGAVIIIGTDEFYYEEMLSIPDADRPTSILWTYDHYRILPFGYQRREDFVRTWVGLDESLEPSEAYDKSSQINNLLTKFLRSNPIPQYPWVIVIVVQAADSPEPLQAENGSYGYLLQALITVALAKSRVKLPIPGKYRWLGELANEMYTHNRSALSTAEARGVHKRYIDEYAVPDLDYNEISADLAAAGVLRIEGDEVSFRQPYTYCYFVAWHLAQRVHAGDTAVRGEIRRLWKDLYHEDTANVLVFLAHLTTSPIALEEMITRATELFRECEEADLST